jgi:hypothetical protein
MERFAVLGVDCVGIADSERAAGTNGDSSHRRPSCLWHLGSHYVAGLQDSNGLGAHAVTRRGMAYAKLALVALPGFLVLVGRYRCLISYVPRADAAKSDHKLLRSRCFHVETETAAAVGPLGFAAPNSTYSEWPRAVPADIDGGRRITAVRLLVAACARKAAPASRSSLLKVLRTTCALAEMTIRFSPWGYFTTMLGLPPPVAPVVAVTGWTKPFVMVPLAAPYHPS